MSVSPYLYQARRWFIFSVLPAIVLGALVYAFVAREPKSYRATATIYIQQPSTIGSSFGSVDVGSGIDLIPTYTQMISSPVVAGKVDQQLARQYPGYRLEAHDLSVGNPTSTSATANYLSQTLLMDIHVTDSTPSRAAAAANTTATVFIALATNLQRDRFTGDEKILQRQLNEAQQNIQLVSQQISTYRGPTSGLNNLRASLTAYESIYQTLIGSAQQFRLAKATALHGLRLFSAAAPPTSPIGPHPAQIASVAGFLALILCAGVVFIYDYLDDTPHGPEQIEEAAGAPILGSVPRFRANRTGVQLVTAHGGAQSPVSEAFRTIRTNLQYTSVDRPLRIIVVTSAVPEEGKSTTTSNLANVFAEAGRQVTLVDADLRRPTLHRIFGLERGDGLTSLLVDEINLNGHHLQRTEQPNLSLIASGPLPPRPADLLASERMRTLLDRFRRESDIVLIDSPPVTAVTDAAILSTLVDGVVLVVDPAKTKMRDLRRAHDAIENVGGKIIGVVINGLERRTSGYYYYSHHYSYNADSHIAVPAKRPGPVGAQTDPGSADVTTPGNDTSAPARHGFFRRKRAKA